MYVAGVIRSTGTGAVACAVCARASVRTGVAAVCASDKAGVRTSVGARAAASVGAGRATVDGVAGAGDTGPWERRAMGEDILARKMGVENSQKVVL